MISHIAKQEQILNWSLDNQYSAHIVTGSGWMKIDLKSSTAWKHWVCCYRRYTVMRREDEISGREKAVWQKSLRYPCNYSYEALWQRVIFHADCNFGGGRTTQKYDLSLSFRNIHAHCINRAQYSRRLRDTRGFQIRVATDQANENKTACTPQPVPTMNENSSHFMSLSGSGQPWFWWYTYLLFDLDCALTQARAFESNGDELSTHVITKLEPGRLKNPLLSRQLIEDTPQFNQLLFLKLSTHPTDISSNVVNNLYSNVTNRHKVIQTHTRKNNGRC